MNGQIRIRYYIQSFACTKKVNTNGKVTQHHSGENIKKATRAIKDNPKYNQYLPKLFSSEVIIHLNLSHKYTIIHFDTKY